MVQLRRDPGGGRRVHDSTMSVGIGPGFGKGGMIAFVFAGEVIGGVGPGDASVGLGVALAKGLAGIGYGNCVNEVYCGARMGYGDDG